MAQDYKVLAAALRILQGARDEVFQENAFKSTPVSVFLLDAIKHVTKQADAVLRGTEAGA